MADEGFSAEELVQACNKIIVYAGLIAKVANVQEVRAVCSSSPLLVAALEGFLGRRLEDVLRSPSTPDERAYNFTLVVDVLSQILNCDLSHISGQRIVEGSIEDISNILELLAALCHGKPLLGPPQAQPTGESPMAPSHADVEASGPYVPASTSAPGGPTAPSQGSPGADAQYIPGTAATTLRMASSGSGSEDDGYRSNNRGRSPLRYPGDEQQISNGDEEVPHSSVFSRAAPGPVQSAYQQEQQQLGQSSHEHSYAPQLGRVDDAGRSLPMGAVRVRRRASGRRHRPSLLQRVVLGGGAHIPLSPIQEVSREGREPSRASKETPGVQSADGASGSGSGSRGSPVRPQQHADAAAEVRRSAGGVSSVISVPSVPHTTLRADSDRSATSAAAQPQQAAGSGVSPGDSEGPTVAAAEAPPPSSYSAGTSTLLERALSQAEAVLRGLGREYEAFYYQDDGDEGDAAGRSRRRARKQQQQQQSQRRRRADSTTGTPANGGGGGIVRGGGPPAYASARRSLRAAPWPDGSSGQVRQHQAFLQRAKRALTEGATTTTTTTAASTSTATTSPSGGPPHFAASVTRLGSRSGSGSRRSSRATKTSSVGPSAAAARSAPRRRWFSVNGAAREDQGQASVLQPAGSGARRGDGGSSTRGGSTGGHHEALVRTLRAGVAPSDGAAAMAQGSRKLLRRAAERPYGSAASVEGFGGSGGDMALIQDRVVGALEDVGHRPQPPALQLNPDLQGRLRYLSRLAQEDPKQRAARAAVESLTVADDLLRHARRRALVERLSRARARREASLRQTADRLHEQSQEYDQRVEQLRLQRLAEEWTASQRSAQMRRALAAELTVRDAFLEVLEGEKEVLLAERQEAKADAKAAFPSYKRAMRKAEQDYVEVFKLLENLLATERQQRVRADREALDAQRYYNKLAAQVVYDRVQELLYRVAREDEATMQGRSVASQPKARRALIAQIRRLLDTA